jgi:hypothetical protein
VAKITIQYDGRHISKSPYSINVLERYIIEPGGVVDVGGISATSPHTADDAVYGGAGACTRLGADFEPGSGLATGDESGAGAGDRDGGGKAYATIITNDAFCTVRAMLFQMPFNPKPIALTNVIELVPKQQRIQVPNPALHALKSFSCIPLSHQGALVLHHTIKLTLTKYPTIALVTPSVSTRCRCKDPLLFSPPITHDFVTVDSTPLTEFSVFMILSLLILLP